MRLSRIAARCPSVKRPAIDAPARWTTASTPLSRSAAGACGFHSRSSSPRAAVRTSLITRWPPVVKNALSADPTRPDAPVMAMTSGCGARLGGVAVGGEVVDELALPVDERRPQRRGGHRRLDLVVHQGPRSVVAERVGVPPARRSPGAARTPARVTPARRRTALPAMYADGSWRATHRNPPGRPRTASPSASDGDSCTTVIGCHGGTSRRIAPGRVCHSHTSSRGWSMTLS